MCIYFSGKISNISELFVSLYMSENMNKISYLVIRGNEVPAWVRLIVKKPLQ